MGKEANRIVYGNTLVGLAKEHDFFVLDADLSKATGTKAFADAYPDRFINMGIAEQDLMSTAAGISSCGVPVFASTFAMFGAGRAYEQIRNTIAYPNANVKVVCSHAGVLIGEDGASHQCLEDLSLMRTIPNMVVLAPCDALQTKKYLKIILEYKGPCYMRFGRLPVESVYEEDREFEIGKGYILKEGKDITLIACGEMVQKALEAAKLLEENNLSVKVVDMPSIKPIDRDLIIECIESTSLIVGIEDHNIIGGLSSAISEVIAEYGKGKILRIGMEDQFGCSGNETYLLEHYALSPQDIAKKVLKEVKR